MSALAARLAGLAPQDSDALLSRIWKDFAATEAFEALGLAMQDLTNEADRALLNPSTSDSARTFAAGQVLSLRRLRATIKAAVNFSPTPDAYSPDVAPDEIPADDNPYLI